MIHPSYVDLMNVVNKGVEEGETPVINSRYSIVMATAKRARQIVDGDEPMVDDAEGKKPLSIAIEELEKEKLQIIPTDEIELEKAEDAALAKARALEENFADDMLEESADEDTDYEIGDSDSEETDDNE
ncbi:MAG: DNA-directed RNA polymerase subunit omega [Firmicutes bacterium]|nr:DNA-directed RNA polymerase subunit omega [Bacillota bacterium]